MSVSSLQSANVYTDLQGLNRLRSSADEESPETLRFVAQQFEAMFLQMMLKSAHTSFGDEEEGLFDNEQTEFYQDWYDKQLSIHLSSGQGVGIADMLVQQLRSRQASATTGTDSDTQVQFAAPVRPMPVAVQPGASTSKEPAATLESPQAFVEQLLPMAQSAAQKLGVAPEVLLAQAALETGWGKKVSQHADGQSSHNLFNIKADHRWQGEAVGVSTLEYREGVAVREQARFRAYESFQAAFDDFVAFLQGSPRYQQALSVAADSEAFTRELAQAGYATDPNYSSKIMGIVNSKEFNETLSAVKL
jgi:flagellar protein FlgJ